MLKIGTNIYRNISLVVGIIKKNKWRNLRAVEAKYGMILKSFFSSE